MSSDLASFDSRLAMRHVREYPHPVDRVWQAVTTSEEMDAWLIPACVVDPRLGGACSFSWGSPAEDGIPCTITEFDPPRVVQYTGEKPGDYLRFELEPTAGGTRLSFIHSFEDEDLFEPADEKWAGGDLPAGQSTPWRPGFCAGFHHMLDRLGHVIEGKWTFADTQAELAVDPSQNPTPEDLALQEEYRRHIKEHCPTD